MSKIRGALIAASVAALTLAAPAASGVAGASSHSTIVDGYHCTVVSHRADAHVTGTPGSVVCALGRSAQLRAGAGTEVLIAGPGHASLTASSSTASVDVLIAGPGHDTLTGGAGTDTLVGGLGSDTLVAGSGTEYLYAGTGADRLVGGSGTDTLVGGPGRDTLEAGSGPSVLVAGTGTQTLSGGSGFDAYIGGTGRTAIRAGSGRDDLLASDSPRTSLDCGGASSSIVASDRGDAGSADCHVNGDHEGTYQFYEGAVSSVSGAQMSVTYAFANDVATQWLGKNGSPTSVTFDLTNATVRSDTGSMTPAVGDCAAVLASTPASGVVLPAVFVELHNCPSSDVGLQRYRGVITQVSGSSMTVAWSDANDTAQAWLAANGHPASVTFDISHAAIESHTGSTTPQANECVRVEATTPSTGLVLSAVRVDLHSCHEDEDGLLGFFGTVTGVTGSQVTVAFTDANDAAQSWLTTHGNPTSVTVDISAAKIESDTGSSTPQDNECIGVAANAPSSGTLLPAVYVFLGGDRCTEDHGPDSDLQRYRGVVSGLTGSQMAVTWSDANDVAQTWLTAHGSPTSVTFDISKATIQSFTGSQTPASGDCVGVSASTPASGTVLPAVFVVIFHCDGSETPEQGYLGTVSGVSGSQMTVTWTHVNDLAQQWLTSKGNPPTVTFDLTGATVQSDTGSSTPATGNCAAVEATTPASGLVLPATRVWLFTCGTDH
jgi:hypothetical protein